MMNGATAAGRQQMWRDRVIALIAGVIAAIAIILVFTSEFLGLPGHWTGPAVVGRTAAMTNMLRIGLNLGNQRADGESDFMQNLFDDPGFEPSIECQLAQVSSQSGTAITVSQWSNGSECNRFWAPGGCTSDGSSGAEGSVRISTTGASLGQTFTVSANTSANSLTCASTCPTLSSGDWISLCKQGPGVASNAFSLGAGWGPGGIGNSDSNVTISYAQHYEGQTALSMVVADGASHKVQFGWDSGGANGGVCSNDNVTPCTVANQTADCGVGNTCQTAPEAGPFHPFVAGKTYAIAFYAKAVNATAPSASVSLARGGGTNILHTFTLINDGVWHQYVYNFNGGDTVTTKDVLTFTLSATNGGAHTGATIYVDDVYLGLAAAAATGFRPEVVTSLTALKPGSLRYMIPSTLDSNDQVFEGPSGCTPGAVGIAGYTSGGCDYLRGGSTTNTGTNLYTYWNWYFGSADVYPLAATVGAVPWVSIPDTFSDADLKTFADNVCTAISTYGFSTVWIEQSNEDWNGIGGGAHFAAASDYYGRLTGRNFNVLSTEISAHCAGSASKIHYIYGNQECNNGVLTAALAGASAAGFPIPNTSNYGSDDATYVSGNRVNPGQLPSYSGSLTSQAGQYAALFFDYAANYNFGANPGCVPGDQRQLLSNQTMAVYESGVGAFNGPGTTEQAYLSEGGFPSAGWMAQNWLLGIQSLLPVQNAFTLTQVEFGYGGSFPYVPAWGLLHDLDADFGPTFPHLRPTGLALAVLNRAITGDYYPMDTSAYSDVYGVAFRSAGNWSAAIINSNSNSVTVPIQFPSGATLPTVAETLLYTKSIADNNENSNTVKIGPLPGGFVASGQTITLTIPPFGVVALEP